MTIPPATASASPASFRGRVRQALTIAKIELRRAFFAKRSLWIYALALLPSLMFFGHGVDVKMRVRDLTRRGLTAPMLLDTVHEGETADVVKKRLGKPAEERWSVRTERVRQRKGSAGITTNVIEPAAEARFVRLNVVRPSYNGDPAARVYEFEVYGTDSRENLALHRPATGSIPCGPDQGPEKAVNGGVTGGKADAWCSHDRPLFLQVDLGASRRVARVVVKHASAGGESDDLDTREFNVQVSMDGKVFTTAAASTGAGFVEKRTEYRQITYFDGRRRAYLVFVDGKLENANISRLLDFEEDRAIFAAIFQYFYLRVAIFFGCLGMFMYLFRGEMTTRTLHYWFLAPARRDVLLAGKFAAGLIAAAVVFGGGALLAAAAMIWPHDAIDVQAFWNAGGASHLFWYTAAAVLGCVGYGSVFLAAGLYVRNPIVPAAVLLAWEDAGRILPLVLQKASILYYLQSLCPVPAPTPPDTPALIRLLASPAAPASRPGAILGLLVLSAFVLWIASRAVRRMQIAYGSEG